MVSKSWNRTETWLALGVVGICAVVVGIAGLWLYMTLTAKALHPDVHNVPSVSRAEPSPRWAAAVEQARQIVRARLSEQNLPGVSVAVGIHGDVVWAEGFGWADLDRHVPVSPTHRFRIGTASTVLTSAAVGLLLEKHRLKLDENIQTYVPEFPRKQWPVTLRQLMAHVSGVRSDGGDEGPLFSHHCDRPVEALPLFADSPLLFEPGSRYHRSNYDWIVASAAVEAAADEPFLTFMRQQIFDPLGMRATGAESTNDIADRATSYFPRFASDPRYGPDPMRDIDLSCYAGAMAFLSTPSDLVRFGFAIDSHTLLEPATMQLLQASQRLPSGQETGHGLGCDLETVTLAGERTRMVGHDGDVLGGDVASFRTFPDRGIVVAVISNISYAKTSALGDQIAEAFVQHMHEPARQ